MSTTTENEEIAQRYGLHPISDGVRRLTKMVAGREASITDVAKVIGQDKDLTARLLRAANPRASCVADYNTTTVDGALQRLGMSATLLFAMSGPLIHGIQETFATMLAIQLKVLPPAAVIPFRETHLVGEINFAGKATGSIQLRLPLSAAPLVGARLLGLQPEDLSEPAAVGDAIGELCNMIGGNFKSNLCDAGLNCKLSLPKVTRTADFKLRVLEGSPSERVALSAPEANLFADLCVNPWTE